MSKIPNSKLSAKDIPSSQASWKRIFPFALTFDGYEQWGNFEKCQEVAKSGIDLFRRKQQLSQSLTDLRTCLFYEARRWRHLDKNPNQKGMEYIHALVDAIRVRVIAGELG
jgi:hypothetical protein